MGHIPRRKPTSGVQVVTDSASDIPEDLVAKHHIEIVPLTIRFGDKEFVDREELPPDAFWRQCAGTSSLPETAAPSPGAFRDAFGRAAASGMDGVVCVNISSGLSGTFQSASAALAALPDGSQVKLIDSTFGSMAHGLVVLAAAEAASAGASIDEVESAARAAVADIKGFFTLDTLENLRRGGADRQCPSPSGGDLVDQADPGEQRWSCRARLAPADSQEGTLISCRCHGPAGGDQYTGDLSR